MKARRKLRQSKSHAVAWIVLVAVIAIGFVSFRAVTSVYAAYQGWLSDLPAIDSKAFNYAEESYMYAADGETLLAKFQLEKRDPVELENVNKYAIDATVDVVRRQYEALSAYVRK